MKKILVISNGPFPTPEQDKVEGGGLRCWGLASGLKSQKNLKVVAAYNEAFKKDNFTDEYQGIEIKTWKLEQLTELISEFDSVLVSYNAGDLTETVVENIRDDQQLILDGYVPIYIEMSARDSDNLDREFDAFNFENKIWTKALKRGDILLCANENQNKFYRGVLSSLGRINPITYNDNDLIKIVPYGVYEDKPVATERPISKILHTQDSFKLLWFGGIYPWFDLKDLLLAVKEISKNRPIELVMVGVKNPFNQHPDFLAKYDEIIQFIKKEKMSEIVHLVDWVKFDDRANWYLDSDAVVLINKIGVENTLAWRTRLVDYVWADLPIITNGGDPLSDILQENKAVKILKSLEKDDLISDITGVIDERSELKNIVKNMAKVRKKLYWNVVTKDLADLVKSAYRPNDFGMKPVEITPLNIQSIGLSSKIMRAKNISKKGIRFANNNGILPATKIVLDKVSRKIQNKTNLQNKNPRIVIVSHQLDNTGAPFVAIDLAESIKKKYPDLAKSVHFITFTPVSQDNLLRLRKSGIKTEIFTDKNLQIQFNEGDIVILNSFGLSEATVMSAINAAKNKTVKKIYWYGHEAEPDAFVGDGIRRQFSKLLKENRASMYAVSKGSLREYRRFFGTNKNINEMRFRFVFPADRFSTKDKSDFEDKISFIMTGAVSDGRKGQLPVLYAFLDFYNNHYKKNKKKYRNFELKYIGVDEGYVKKQMELSAIGLDDKIKITGKLSHDEALDEIEKSNITICYSVHEAMGIFVYEGMAFGHPIVRNECAGQEEQLIDGVDGFKVDSKDFTGLVKTIDMILDKSKTSASTLAKMSKESEKIARGATVSNYYIIDEIAEDFKK